VRHRLQAAAPDWLALAGISGQAGLLAGSVKAEVQVAGAASGTGVGPADWQGVQ